MVRPRRSAFVAVLSALVLLGGCSDEAVEERRAVVGKARAALEAGDANGALSALRLVWNAEAPDPSLALVGARASLALKRHDDVIKYARAGLGADFADAGLKADLEWARGKALLARYHELKADTDRRAAGVALEEGTRAGNHRGEAAALLALLQLAGRDPDTARFERFGRMALELDPDGVATSSVRTMFETLGIDL